MRRPHLTQHMGFADDGTVERTCHREKMFQRRVTLMAIEGSGDGFLRRPQARGGQRHEQPAGTIVVAPQLDPVTGRNQHRLVQSGRPQRLERAVAVILEQGEAIAQRRRAGTMIEADHRKGTGHRRAAVKRPREARAGLQRRSGPRKPSTHITASSQRFQPCRTRSRMRRRCRPSPWVVLFFGVTQPGGMRDLVPCGKRGKLHQAGGLSEAGAAKKDGQIFQAACDRNRPSLRVFHQTYLRGSSIRHISRLCAPTRN